VALFFNGQPAEKYFRKLVLCKNPARYEIFDICTLPSTSGAYALSKEAKLEAWRVVQRTAAK
jgi:G:T/U-mismatch repair DNA glycosylase